MVDVTNLPPKIKRFCYDYFEGGQDTCHEIHLFDGYWESINSNPDGGEILVEDDDDDSDIYVYRRGANIFHDWLFDQGVDYQDETPLYLKIWW